jgi:hypothetical protein
LSARADITTYDLVLNAGTAAITGGTADANLGHEVAFRKARRLVIRINEGTSTAGTWTFKAGSRDVAAPKGGQGDLVILPGASATQYVVVESARFMQADGNLYIDVNSVPGTRTIAALRLPAVG